MICIKCGQNNTQVVNSRQNKKAASVWRRRRCRECGCTYTTYEGISLDQIEVLSDSTTVPFHHTTLLISIASCFEHSTDQRAKYAEALTKTVEEALVQSGAKTSTKAISEATYEVLKRFDSIAAVQYAAHHSKHLSRYLRV